MTTVDGPLAAALVARGRLEEALALLLVAAGTGQVSRHEIAVADVQAEHIRRAARAWLDTRGHERASTADIPGDWITVDLLARQLGVTARHARRLAAALPGSRRVGGRWQIRRADVEDR